MTNPYIGYKCACCGKEGVKLWKVYKYSAPELKCYECACVGLGVGQKDNPCVQSIIRNPI